MAENDKNIQDFVAETAASYVSELWKTHQDATREYINKLIDWSNQYKGVHYRKQYDGLANVYVNETLEACESIVAQTFHEIYSEAKPVHVMGREETDDKKAGLVEMLMLNSLDQMKHKTKMLRQIRQCVEYGTTWANVHWKYEEKVDPTTGEKVIVSHADMRKVDLLDIAFDPGKFYVEDMDWVIERKRVGWDYIKDRERSTLYSKKQTDKIDKNSRYIGDIEKKNQRFQSSGIQYQKFHENDYEILEFWGKVPRWWVDEDLDMESDEASERVQVVIEVLNGNNPTVLRLERNPYRHQEIPYLKSIYIEKDGETYGIGVCQITESLQAELNDKRNQLLDHATFQIFPQYIVNRASGIKEIEGRPREIIRSTLSGDQAMTPLRVGGNPTENVVMENIVKQDMRNQSGASNPVQGISSNKDTTAYEASVLERRSSSRIRVFTNDFAENFLRRFYRLVYKLNQQFITKEMAVRIAGKEGIRFEQITPQDLINDFDFIPNIPTDLDSRSIMRSQMIQFIQSIGPMYPRINVYKIVRKIYELFGFNDVDEVVPEPDTEKGQNDLTPEEEIAVLSQGQDIDVKWYDNHLQKLAFLMQFLDQNQQNMSPQATKSFQNKIFQHTKYLETLQSAMASMQGSQGGSPSLGTPPTPKRESVVSSSANGFRNLTAV